ncbi:MAG TPA: RsmE family RNA methyltransferase [Labilithrix sp.]|jgi:16S rRNA (uracil1498-N3)-methyltransferase
MNPKARAPVQRLAPGPRTLNRDVSRYLCRVLRLDKGDAFVAFDPSTYAEADAIVDDPSHDGALVTVGELRRAALVAESPLVVIQALAKGDKVDNIIRDATELGATRIVIARATRCVAKIGDGLAPTRLDRWRRIAEQAARQCGRADPPSIDGIFDWPKALDEARDVDARFCLDKDAIEPLGTRLPTVVTSGASMAFAIGPEGGLTEEEIETALDKAFAPVQLGRFVLRTETVATAVLGAVRVLKSAS